MAESLKLLGQSRPAATTAATLYAVPTNGQAVVSSLVVCNTTTSPATFRLFASTGGATFTVATALFYDVTVAAGASTILQLGLALGALTNLGVASGTASALTFSAFGQELT